MAYYNESMYDPKNYGVIDYYDEDSPEYYDEDYEYWQEDCEYEREDYEYEEENYDYNYTDFTTGLKL